MALTKRQTLEREIKALDAELPGKFKSLSEKRTYESNKRKKLRKLQDQLDLLPPDEPKRKNRKIPLGENQKPGSSKKTRIFSPLSVLFTSTAKRTAMDFQTFLATNGITKYSSQTNIRRSIKTRSFATALRSYLRGIGMTIEALTQVKDFIAEYNLGEVPASEGRNFNQFIGEAYIKHSFPIKPDESTDETDDEDEQSEDEEEEDDIPEPPTNEVEEEEERPESPYLDPKEDPQAIDPNELFPHNFSAIHYGEISRAIHAYRNPEVNLDHESLYYQQYQHRALEGLGTWRTKGLSDRQTAATFAEMHLRAVQTIYLERGQEMPPVSYNYSYYDETDP